MAKELNSWFMPRTMLLNMKDKNKETPEIFIVTTNRTGGKSYGVSKMLLEDYFEKGEKFALLTRWTKDLGNVANGIMDIAIQDNFPDYELVEEVRMNGVYSQLFLTHRVTEKEVSKECCGYVLPINGSDNIKKISSVFYDVETLFLDEFQAEKYCPNEINKFTNLHFSIARGGPNGVRYVKTILASNTLDITNPYFDALGMSSKIQTDTKRYRGEGFVYCNYQNEVVANAQKESAFNRAFSGNKQIQSNIDNSWLNNNWISVGKPDGTWGRGTYIFTIIDDNNKYGVMKYDNGYWYIGRKIDETCSNVYSMSVDGTENIEVITRCSYLPTISNSFKKGLVRFSDVAVKERVLSFI